MEPLLQIEDYTVTFQQYDRGWTKREFSPVQHMNLNIYSGEIVAVVGASGSGKSLLAHGILGILPYNAYASGNLVFEGQKLTQKRMERLRGKELVLIPQSTSFLNPLMKVGKQICKGSRKRSVREKMRRLLHQYHLDKTIEDKYPFELSGGMTRRVMLTMAQMEQPKLVIADEPTPGLHKEMARMALGHLRELSNQGTGVLLITHDLEQALMVSDRIAVCYEGKVVEEARAEDFLQEETLRHPYTKALWRAMPQHGFQWENCKEKERSRNG